MADGSKITKEEWPDIVAGAWAYRELHGYNDFRINAQRFLYNREWEGALEELAEYREQQQVAYKLDRYDQDQEAAAKQRFAGIAPWADGFERDNVVDLPQRRSAKG